MGQGTHFLQPLQSKNIFKSILMIKPLHGIIIRTLVFLLSLSVSIAAVAQETTPNVAARIQQTLDGGQITPQQVQQGMAELQTGGVSPETVRQYQKKAEQGTLTPEEIEAGQKLLDFQMEKTDTDQPRQDIKTAAPLDQQQNMTDVLEAENSFFKKTPAAASSTLPIFGHKLFSGDSGKFTPLNSIPVSDNYVIGPGDEIKILLWGRIDATYSLKVDNDGSINYPKIGPLTVAGLTFEEVKTLIQRKTEAITGVNVNVTMGRLRTIQVFVLGEVKSPGIYTVGALATVSNALLSSGGPTALGSLRRVELKRQDRVVSTIDLYDFLLRGDISADIRMMPGDVVFVPQAGSMVKVSGNVKRPAVYELGSDGTLSKTLDLAGGLAPRAFNQRIQIERAHKNRIQKVLDIAYGDLNGKSEVRLQDGDVIRIFSILPFSANAVYLYGNVLRPGRYACKPDMRLLDLVPDIGSLTQDTYFDYALIKRYHQEGMQAELLPFDLGRLLLSRDASQNLTLAPLDEIYIFNKNMFEDREYATIEGQVRKPGKYFIDEMKIRDLILKAGDLKKEAYRAKAEIVRIDPDRNSRTLYFDLGKALADDPAHNLKLQHEDRIVIHSVWEDQWRRFVNIDGEVKNAGQYLLTRGMRLKDLIFKAGQFTRDAYFKTGHLMRTDWRTKQITMYTFNVEKTLAGDADHNLLLQDLDQVVIHSTWEYREKYTVSIKGQINRPGDYPFASNMTVKDLILVAGNIKDAAYLENAELTRFHIVDGRKVETFIYPLNLRKVRLDDPDHNLKLQPLDVVTVKEIPEWWGQKKTVTLAGEFNFPGTYQIRNGEQLNSAIERAGGFSDYAYLRGTVFTRTSVQEIQQKRLNEMMQRLEVEVARLSSTEAQKALSAEDLVGQAQFASTQKVLLDKLKKTQASGRVVLNIVPLSVLAGHPSNITIEDGDTLFVPKKPHTINVLGSVYNPTSILFDEKHPELKYYLGKTGGPTENAQKDSIYIVRTDGTVVSSKGGNWLGMGWNTDKKRWGFGKKFQDTPLGPGDTVLVPEKVARPTFMKDAKDITQILYQIAVTAGITITQIF